MLALSEIWGLAAAVSEDGRCEVADAVAASWGLAPGAARFWRSSASHVFAVKAGKHAAYLKFAPERVRGRAGAEAVAALMRDLPGGAAKPLPALSGRLAETVATARGPMAATLVAAAPGVELEPSELTSTQARAWGAALARLHRDASPGGLRETFADIGSGATPGAAAGATPGATADAELADAVARLARELDRLPRDPRGFGVVHGDFELDNLAWEGDTPTAYDFDEAGLSWAVADIAHALRDADSVTQAGFIAGYRSVRELSDVDLGRLPLFSAAHAAMWLLRLPAILDVPPEEPGQPAWLETLRRKLVAHAARQRSLVLEFALRQK